MTKVATVPAFDGTYRLGGQVASRGVDKVITLGGPRLEGNKEEVETEMGAPGVREGRRDEQE